MEDVKSRPLAVRSRVPGVEEDHNSVRELRAMLKSDDPETAEEGIQKSLALIQLHPEDFLKELIIPLASAVWEHEDFQRNLEESLADIAKDRPTYISTDVLQKLGESEHWYFRWLALWTINNISYGDPNLVPTELLEKLTKDEKWWNREFAEGILNRVWRSRARRG